MSEMVDNIIERMINACVAAIERSSDIPSGWKHAAFHELKQSPYSHTTLRPRLRQLLDEALKPEGSA